MDLLLHGVSLQGMDVSRILSDGPHEGHILPLDQQLPQRTGGLGLGLYLEGLIQHDVHELIETEDLALETDGVVIVEPDLHAGLVLQELEDDRERVDALGLSLLRHL